MLSNKNIELNCYSFSVEIIVVCINAR
uniref:Uncharacterized protein n=1 Tax=Arundo donax TaxID=35708 RepID=A0A0A9ERY9_ARUDO